MEKYRTLPEIIEIWKQARPSERRQIRSFIEANTGYFFLCKILDHDTQAEMISVGWSLDGDGVHGSILLAKLHCPPIKTPLAPRKRDGAMEPILQRLADKAVNRVPGERERLRVGKRSIPTRKPPQ